MNAIGSISSSFNPSFSSQVLSTVQAISNRTEFQNSSMLFTPSFLQSMSDLKVTLMVSYNNVNTSSFIYTPASPVNTTRQLNDVEQFKMMLNASIQSIDSIFSNSSSSSMSNQFYNQRDVIHSGTLELTNLTNLTMVK